MRLPTEQTLVLGADAQTLSWSQVMVDFPQLGPERTAVSEALRKARGFELLRADVFTVHHHGSKHGLNLELAEAIKPSLSLISSVGGGGKYEFPHDVAINQLREALEPISGKPGTAYRADYELGVHYTCSQDDHGDSLGTIGLIMSPTGRRRRLWRFMDGASDDIDPDQGRRLVT